MRHSVRMSTLVRKHNKQENKLVVFEVEDLVNLESELKRRTQLLINEGNKILDQTIVLSKMRTSY